MASTLSSLSLLVVLCVSALVTCRPQGLENDAESITPSTTTTTTASSASSAFDTDFQVSDDQFGFIIGDIQVYSDQVAVSRPKKKKTPPPPKEAQGPRTFALVSGGPPEADFASFTPGASSPSLSISGSTITFGGPASVVNAE